MKDETVLPIKGWMINQLRLTGNELLVFAWICKYPKWRRFRTTALANDLGMKRGQAQYCLNKLSKDGNIKKRKALCDGKIVNEYKTEFVI